MITASLKDQKIGAGLVISIGLHIALVLLVVLGLPIFWQKDPLPEVIGIQMATMSDITAAPKAQKVAPEVKKGADAPKVEQKQPPKPDTPPPPPVEKQAATPPPQPAPTPPQPESKPAEQPKPEEAEVIPDKTKKPEEKKPDEKKPEPPKPLEKQKPDKKPDPKPKKDTSDQDLNSLLNNVLKDQPAPDTKADKTKPVAPSQPQQDASQAPQTSQFSEIPLSASEANGIGDQVRQNWNIGSLAGAPDLDKLNVTMHITLQPDGTIISVTYDNDQPGNPYFKQAAESGVRALKMTKQLKLPPGKTYEKITFIFQPALMQ